MHIRLNGDPFEIPAPLSISALLAQLRIEPRRVAVEHNTVVIKRANYDTTTVTEGDEVEIVNFVGGGSGEVHPGSGIRRSALRAAFGARRSGLGSGIPDNP